MKVQTMVKKKKSKNVFTKATVVSKKKQAIEGMGTPAKIGENMANKLGKIFGW
jgi:hypothetical protein